MSPEETPPPGAAWKRLAVTAGGLCILALLARGFLEGRKEAAIEREREQPIKAPSRVRLSGDSIVVSLDSAALARSGIVTQPVQAASGREQFDAYGTVVDVSTVIETRNTYVSAKAKLEQDRARLKTSLAEWNRTEALYADSQSVSTKTLQEAEAAYRLDQSASDADTVTLVTIAASARQNWGPEIAAWVTSGSDQLQRLFDGTEVLIQVTLPPDSRLASRPTAVTVLSPHGSALPARVVSSAGRADPRVQGQSYFAIARRGPDLFPGMNVGVTVPGDRQVRGSLIPDSAVVWWQGKAWVYLARTPATFVRHEISDATRLGRGLLATDIPSTTLLVVAGAQALLSEELRAQIEVGEDEGKR